MLYPHAGIGAKLMAPKNTKFLERLAVAVASGSTIRAAANGAGCSIDTAYGLSKTSEFRQRVGEIRSEATSAAIGKLSTAASLAVDALVTLLASEDSRDRLNAAKAILVTLQPLSEFGELRSRIDRLESDKLRIA